MELAIGDFLHTHTDKVNGGRENPHRRYSLN